MSETYKIIPSHPVFITRFAHPLECHQWSTAPASACLRRGPRGNVL